MPEKRTLAEANRIYQQRHRVKLRKNLGNDLYLQEQRDYMRIYRDARNHAEGYVKPAPVVKLVKPPHPKPSAQPQTVIQFKEVNRGKKKTKKQQDRIELLKARLKNKPLRGNSLNGYVSKHINMYKMFTGDDSQTLNGWKQDLIKALQGHQYDHGLHEVISYFKQIKEVLESLHERFKDKESSYKAFVGAITGLLGRLQTNEYDTEYEYASNTGIVLQKEYTESRDLNELPEEEMTKISKILFDDQSITDNIKKLTTLRDKALYAIYMYIPRRLEVGSVIIRLNDKNTDKKENYLILNGPAMVPDRFIFNRYKTSSSYHQQVVDVPEQIQPIIHEYIIENNLKKDDYLFPLARSAKEKEADSGFSKKLSNVLSQVYGMNVTNQDLRTAYATYWNQKAKSKADKNKVATALSHSYEVNEQYVKTNIKQSN